MEKIEQIIKLNEISKKKSNAIILNNISFGIKKGSICGVVGKNGAGKTSLLKIIAGFSGYSGGVFQCDENLRISAFIESNGLLENMTAYDNLKIKALVNGIDKERILEVMDLVKLQDDRKKKVKNYSTGMRQRLGIGLAILDKPDVIILDEPLNGIDIEGVTDIRNIILDLNKNQKITFIISSHIISELELICDTYVILEKGEIILCETSDALKLIKKEKNVSLEEIILNGRGQKWLSH